VKREVQLVLLFIWFISFIWLNLTTQVNQTDHKRRGPDAVGGDRAEPYGLTNPYFDQATESCLGRCARDRKVCRFNWLTR
jgi:hypothetical protein